MLKCCHLLFSFLFSHSTDGRQKNHKQRYVNTKHHIVDFFTKMQFQCSSPREFFRLPSSQPYTSGHIQNAAAGEENLINFHTLCPMLKIRSHSCNCKSKKPGRTVKQSVNISCFWYLVSSFSLQIHHQGTKWDGDRENCSDAAVACLPQKWDWCDTAEKCCCLLLTESAREWLLLPRDLWGAAVMVDTLLLSASSKIRVEPTKALVLGISIKPCIHRRWLTIN